MSVLLLTSATGSPGVTTTALGLAMAWPRPAVLVDADPTGSKAVPAGLFRGGHLPAHASLVDLAISHRQGTLETDLPGALMPLPESRASFIRGASDHKQAKGLSHLWRPLMDAFFALEDTGQDVIIDAGRLGLQGYPTELLQAADLTLLATRTNLPALVGSYSWATSLREQIVNTGRATAIGALAVGPGRPYKDSDVSRTLHLPVVASVAWDPRSAEVLSYGARKPRKYAAMPLNRSLEAAALAIWKVLDRSRSTLRVGQEGVL